MSTQKILGLLIVAIMAMAPVLAGPVPDSSIATVEATLDNQGSNGDDKLQGEWRTVNQLHQLYLRNSGVLDHSAAGSCGNTGPSYSLLYDPASDEADLGGFGPATFTLGTTPADMTLNTWWANIRVGTNEPTRIRVELMDGANTIPGTNIDIDVGSTAPDDFLIPAFGGDILGSHIYINGARAWPSGLTIPAGTDLAVRVSVISGWEPSISPVEMSYNCDTTTGVTLVGQVAHHNSWVEDGRSIETSVFPLGANAPPEDREVRFHSIFATGFGADAYQGNRHSQSIELRGPDMSKPAAERTAEDVLLWSSNGGVDQGKGWSVFPANARDQPVPGIQDNVWRLKYTAGYAGEGQHTLLVGANGQTWNEKFHFTIGGGVLSIAPAPFETVTKTILNTEPETQFVLRVTNAGSTTDTALLSVPANQDGWTATATPTQLNLPPGVFQDVVVSVNPPAGAISGASKAFKVDAVSQVSGQAASQTVTVILTNVPSRGIDLVSEPVTFKVAPTQTRTTPVVLKNLGNAAEGVVLSTSGAPLGWTATISPATTELVAKGQRTHLVSITAPPDASSGTRFALNVKAVAVNDNTVTDSLTIPVEVFFQDGFALGVFDAVDPTTGLPVQVASGVSDILSKATKGGAAFWQDKTATGYSHTLRDEGPDADTRQSCAQAVPVAGNCIFSTSSSAWDANNDPDKDFDQSTMFRVMLRNDGDRQDRFLLTPNWYERPTRNVGTPNTWGYLDRDDCEHSDSGGGDPGGDLAPDGWRFAMWDPSSGASRPLPPGQGQSGRQFSIDNFAMTVDVPAHSTKYVFIEMGWEDPYVGNNNCPNSVQGRSNAGGRGSDPGTGQAVELHARSQNDATNQQTIFLHAKHLRNAGQDRLASQRYTDQVNDVALHIDDNSATMLDSGNADTVLVRSGGTTEERTATYRLRAVNTGNEFDTIILRVPSEQQGWTYDIPVSATQTNIMRDSHGQGRTSGQQTSADCRALSEANFKTLECTMGSWDEVVFDVKATAPSNAELGSKSAVLVSASSKDSFQQSNIITKTVPLTTTARGTFGFALEPDPLSGRLDIQIYPGEALRIPFSVSNQGTQNDEFIVDFLSEPEASTGWQGLLSMTSPAFIPALSDLNGFVTIVAPDSAAVGAQSNFVVRVKSTGDPTLPAQTLRIVPTVQAPPGALTAQGNPPEVLGLVGSTVDVAVKATRTSGGATSVTFTPDASKLPAGWGITPSNSGAVSFDSAGSATSSFTVSVPSTAIGTSRAVIPFVARDSDDNERRFSVVVNLESSSFGIKLNDPLDFEATFTPATIIPGSTVDVPVLVRNLGGGVDSVDLSTDALPTGWTVTYSEDPVALQPRQNKEVMVTIGAPATLAPGEGRDIQLKGTSSDASRTSTLALRVTTGGSAVVIDIPAGNEFFQGPEQTVAFTATVFNNGTVRDELILSAGLGAAHKDIVPVLFTPSSVTLGPGESKPVSVAVKIPAGFLPNALIPIDITATSKGPLLNSVGITPVTVKVLQHRVLDVDDDGRMEYALDRDREASNGMEHFQEINTTGRTTVSLDMASFLTEAARASFTATTTVDNETVTVFTFRFDLDGDGRVEHFLDLDADGLPDRYWNPDLGALHQLTFAKDINADGVREYFVDVNGDQLLDVYYDLKTGKVGKLLRVDVDDDEIMDYIVDLNGNGERDSNEPILFGRSGGIAKVTELIDVDGDGRLDLVVDEDGDGVPDYFIPAGQTQGKRITMQDMNNDGVLDWTYDSDGDGRRDSYYDPVAGKTSRIDTTQGFLDNLGKYWYVTALFALVSALFVVLVVVTRR